MTATIETSSSDNPSQARRKAKRGQREGTVYQRRDGVWVGRIMLGRKSNGEPDRPKVSGPTRADVNRQLAELRLRAEQGQSVDVSQARQSVADYLGDWLDAAGTTTRSQTLVGYRQIVRDHITPSLGRHKLSALRPDAIQRLYAAKLAEGLSPYTVRKTASSSTAHSNLRCAGATFRAIPLTMSTRHQRPSAPCHPRAC